METLLILAGLWLLIAVVLAVLIGRGVRDLRTLKDGQRSAVGKNPNGHRPAPTRRKFAEN